jgi:hypothetical protein
MVDLPTPDRSGEDGKSLALTWQVAALELCGHFRKGEPAANLQILGQLTPQLRARQVPDPGPRRNFVFRQVGVELLDVHQDRKRHQSDAELFFVFPHQFLGGIRGA